MELLQLYFPECILRMLAVPLAAYGVLVLAVLCDLAWQRGRKD